MGAAAPFIPIIVKAIGAAAAVYGAVESHEAGRSARNTASDQFQTSQMEQEAATQKAQSVQNTQIPDEQIRRQRATTQAAASGVQGAMGAKQGTMLTGPSGIAGSMLNLGKNTLLGQ